MKYAAICAALLLSVATVSYAATDADTENFIKNTYAANLGEVEMGKLAVQKSQNADVKKFGQNLTADHSKANDDLKTVAAKFEITLPSEMASEHKAMYDRLTKMEGPAFDRAFVAGAIDDHTKCIDMFNKYVTSGSVAEVKDWASRMLPALKQHLDMARELDTRLTKGASFSSGDMDARTMNAGYQRDNEAARFNTSVGADAGFEPTVRYDRAERYNGRSYGDRMGGYERGSYVSYGSSMHCESCEEHCEDCRYHTPRVGENLDVVYDNDWNATTTDTINTCYGNY